MSKNSAISRNSLKKKDEKVENNKGKKKIELEFSDSEDDSDVEFTEEKDISNNELHKKQIEYKTGELEYSRLSLHEQILLRPDTYVGSTRRLKSSGKIWVKVKDQDKFVRKEVTYTEASIRTFMEFLSNAIDNIWRSKQFKIPTKYLDVKIDRENGFLSVENDGKPIPFDFFVEKKNGVSIVTKEYIPEAIFGSVLTSSNYNDNEKRKTSGRNGFGGKLGNIFANELAIKLYNPNFQSIYQQKWTNNMFNKFPPEFIKDKKQFPTTKGKTGYTQVRWKPDFKRFNMTGIDDDFMCVAEKVIYDYALIAALNGVTTFYNDKKVPVTDLKSYVQLYMPNDKKDNDEKSDSENEDKESSSEEENEDKESDNGTRKKSNKKDEILVLKSSDCDVVLVPKVDPTFKGELMHISFVNGIHTKEGGVHVDDWAEAIFRPIVNKINKVKPETDEKSTKSKTAAKKDNKNKKNKPDRFQIDITHVKKYFTIFVVAEADNPEFKTQEKNNFAGPPIAVNVKKSDIQKLLKWEFVEEIERNIKLRELASLKDLGKKKRNYTRVEGLDDANFAGDKKKSQECILVLCEGKSAAAYVTKGLKYGILGNKGHNLIGILPLTGKILNVRNASNASISKNKVVKGIIRALGLEVDLDYTKPENRKKLRYGKLCMIGDSDKDGGHITGLLYNLLDVLSPSLLESGDFFYFMRTPIVKVNKEMFLFQTQAEEWLKEHNVSKNVRYFKGLGTSNNKDVKEDFGKYIVNVKRDPDGIIMARNVFHEDESDFRKQWLLDYKPRKHFPVIKPYEIETLNVSDFFNKEMIEYSLDDCMRSIPHVLDGNKESQRKCLAAAFKRKLNYNKKSLKVAQFAGYVAEHMGYVHGEQNLYDTITKMGQRFPGSNNISIFLPDGMFGTRLENGKDASKARYLHTKLDMLTRLIFRPEDDDYLEDRIEENQVVEKKYYIPIIPMLLVNGASGIGTGSSCNVPSYNIMDIIDWINIWLDNDGKIKSESDSGMIIYETPELVPYFRGFKGQIEVDGTRITTYGILNKTEDNDTYEITELPVGRLNCSITKFKERLEKMYENKQIKKPQNLSTENDPHFIITVDDDGIVPSIQNLKLKDTMNTSNMVLWNEQGQLVKFKTVEDIMCYFCTKRLELYKKRKQGLLHNMQNELKWVSNKIKFIKMVCNGELILENREETDIEKDMDKLKFDRKLKGRKNKKPNNDSKDDIDNEENDNEDDNENDIEDGEDIIDNKNMSFDYLLDMKRRTFNIKSKMYANLQKEKEKIEKEIIDLKDTSEKTMWKKELKELKDTYPKWDKQAKEEDSENIEEAKLTKSKLTKKRK